MRKGNKLVIIQIKDSIALLEYCHVDYKDQYVSKFDTLELNKQGYVGKFSKIVLKNNGLQFKPGNLLLKQGIPDTSFNKMRNLGYLQYTDAKFNQSFEWAGFTSTEFNKGKWESKSALNPEDFRNKIQNAYDSLYLIYSSKETTAKFKRVIIRNTRLFPKTYLDNSDSLEILRVWKLLASGKPVENKMLVFYLQYPLSLVPMLVLGLGFEYAILGSGIVYPILIGSEKFIFARFKASSTYKILFLQHDKKMKNLEIKVRNSKIMGENYNYKLPFDFEKDLLRKK